MCLLRTRRNQTTRGTDQDRCQLSGNQEGLCKHNNHAQATVADNDIVLSQKLAVRLKAMLKKAMLSQFPQLSQRPESMRLTMMALSLPFGRVPCQ